MSRHVIAVYPGTFDPITLGHEDIIRRARELFDEVIVAVAVAHHKKTLFSLDERLAMVQESVTKWSDVRAESFDGLLSHYVRAKGGKAMVRGLREYLLPAWSRCDENNYSLVVNPSDTMAIAVATGDDATGRIDVSPTTKSSKGPSTADAVSSNQLQLELPYIFDSAPAAADDGAPEEKRITWIFLVHRARDEVRCELSLPTSMGTDGRVDKWRERIILKAFPTDPEVIEIRPPQPLPDISVDVKRRA